MIAERLKPEDARSVTVAAVDAYLSRHGWMQKASPRPTSRYYEHPELKDDQGQPLHLFYPASEHFADYPLRVIDTVSSLASLYDTTPEAVLRELLGGGSAGERNGSAHLPGE